MALTRRILFSCVLTLLFSVYGELRPLLTGPPISSAALARGGPWSRLLDTRTAAFRSASVRPDRSRAAIPPLPPRLVNRNAVLSYAPPPIMARAAYSIDLTTGHVLFAKNANRRLPMASTTKITTAVVVLQHAHLSDLAWVSKRAATIGESSMELARGEQLTVKQLLYGLLLNSANDAAIALAEHVSGNEERFVGLMNRLARKLHMRHTHYVTAHGLDAPGHYTSAHDLAVITRYAMRNATFRQIVDTVSYHIRKTKHNAEHWLASVNRAIYWYPGVDGVKPGDTDNAGLCQVVSAWRNGRHVLAVLLNTPNLVTDLRNLLDYGATDFQWVPSQAYWDGPSLPLSGTGSRRWLYYVGAGHYIRDAFLDYYQTHHGLSTLGFPRTEAIDQDGQQVQYFQGGELIFDPVHGTVYPMPLGVQFSARFASRVARVPQRAGNVFTRLYKRLGGAAVLGLPITRQLWVRGTLVQFFQYGELARIHGTSEVVPIGDALLQIKGWLPAVGAADTYPDDMTPAP